MTIAPMMPHDSTQVVHAEALLHDVAREELQRGCPPLEGPDAAAKEQRGRDGDDGLHHGIAVLVLILLHAGQNVSSTSGKGANGGLLPHRAPLLRPLQHEPPSWVGLSLVWFSLV
eukprot:scaffold991_cov227-Pinguiococcus_pyrenoidosus.AAC.11